MIKINEKALDLVNTCEIESCEQFKEIERPPKRSVESAAVTLL